MSPATAGRPSASRSNSRRSQGAAGRGASGARSPRALAAERRRRERHFARRRRDLIQDGLIGLGLAIFLLNATAGLGVLALLEVPLVGALLATLVAERVIRRRRARGAPGPRRRR